MPQASGETAALVSDLMSRIDRLVSAARQEGREAALTEVRHLVGGAVGVGARPALAVAAPAARATRGTDKRRSSWSSMTPEARLARVNAIRRGKGLPPKDKL
jgi:hypothetical protein